MASRVSQLALESVIYPLVRYIRISQQAIEIIVSQRKRAYISQAAIEIIVHITPPAPIQVTLTDTIGITDLVDAGLVVEGRVLGPPVQVI